MRVAFVTRTAAHENVGSFFEIEQPKRQVQIVDGHVLGASVERRRVLAMRIEQHDVRSVVFLEDGADDQAHRARFTGAGRTEQAEVFVEQFVGENDGGAVRIVEQRADVDTPWRRLVVNHVQIGFGRRRHRVAGCRIGAHPASERAAGGRCHDLAQHVGDDGLARGRVGMRTHVGDHRDDVAEMRHRLDQRADADRRPLGTMIEDRVQACAVDGDDAAASALVAHRAGAIVRGSTTVSSPNPSVKVATTV